MYASKIYPGLVTDTIFSKEKKKHVLFTTEITDERDIFDVDGTGKGQKDWIFFLIKDIVALI